MKKYCKNLENEMNLLLQKAKNLKLIDKQSMKSVLTKKTQITKFLLSSIFNNSKTFVVSHINFQNSLISPELLIDLYEFQNKSEFKFLLNIYHFIFNRFKNLSCNAIKNTYNLEEKSHSKNIFKFHDMYGKK